MHDFGLMESGDTVVVTKTIDADVLKQITMNVTSEGIVIDAFTEDKEMGTIGMTWAELHDFLTEAI